MLSVCSQASLNIDPRTFRDSFDREPFGFTHTLSELDLFKPDALRALAEKYTPRDYYVAGGAVAPGAEFYSVRDPGVPPHEALDRLDSMECRVLLKRPEKYDPGFRALLDALFRQVVDLRGGLGRDRVVRLEAAVLVSSAATITPFHFDPEINFFSQIEGEKVYHVFSPAAVTEAELESFYINGRVEIGQVELQGRDPAREHTFALGPGKGLHQPQNAPHWVETRASRSVSYAFVFETNASRARGRVRAFNHFMRKSRLNPAPPGHSPAIDGIKAGTMRPVIFVRKGVAKVYRTIRKRLSGSR